MSVVSIGIASAQGNVADIKSGGNYQEPQPFGEDGTPVSLCRPARGISRDLSGTLRWQALAEMALRDCCSDIVTPSRIPLLVASCNGNAAHLDTEAWRSSFESGSLLARTPWRTQNVPVISGSCASGLQALYLAAWMLRGNIEEVVVLAVDALSPVARDNFESLRILSTTCENPWQTTSTGFITGEAGIALHLRLADSESKSPAIVGMSLGCDDSELVGGAGELMTEDHDVPVLIYGQGTGPHRQDMEELRSIGEKFSQSTPLTTPTYHFGHTLGASGVLSVALAALAGISTSATTFLKMPTNSAANGHRLYQGGPEAGGTAFVHCRALNGQCGAAILARTSMEFTVPVPTFEGERDVGTIGHPFLRELARVAPQFRPRVPPDVLIVNLDAPIQPAGRSIIGTRLLPTAVLEITPGYVPALIARRWGYTGPAICLVGRQSSDGDALPIVQALADAGLSTSIVSIHGTGENRAVTWITT